MINNYHTAIQHSYDMHNILSFSFSEIYMPNAIFYLNDVFQTLPCNVTNPEQWSSLILYFTPQFGARRALVTVLQSGSVDVYYDDRHVVTADYSISQYFLKLNIHFLREVCRFEGRYTCSLTTPSTVYNSDSRVVIQGLS